MINFTKSKNDNLSLEISVQSACSKLCDYCPQSNYISNYKKKFFNEEKILTFETVKLISKNIPSKTIIKWTGFTEPLDFKEFDNSVEFFFYQGFKQQISTTLLGKKNSQKFYKENLDKFFSHTIHLPDNKNLMKGKFDNEYSEYVESVIRLLDKNSIEYSIFLIGENFHINLQHTIKKLTKEINIKDKIIKAKYLNTRASKIEPELFGLKQTNKNHDDKASYYCSYKRLNQGVLLPNGKVVLCCQDYGLDFILGDLKDQNLGQLYKTIEEDSDLRSKFIDGKFSPCNRCEHYSPIERETTSVRTL